MIIQILVDNPDSWIVPFAVQLVKDLTTEGHSVSLLHNPSHVKEGDILCLLSCEKIFKSLHLNKHNLVVHESLLPKGKGWSPLTWQVLEGKNKIPITLFEATNDVDSGMIYLQDFVILSGHELIDEIRELQGNATIRLIKAFISNPLIQGRAQKGESSYYSRRTAADSRLNVDKTIKEQFNLLRIVDNERYPAFFEYKGTKYKIIIEKMK